MSEQPCAFHPDRLTRVTCSRCDRPICPDDMISAPVGIHCPVCAGRMREGALGEAAYRVRERTERIPFVRKVARADVTSAILVANIVVFLLMLSTVTPTSPRTLYRFGALPGVLPASQWWRLITAMFVHIGLFHIAFNMFALVMFGRTLEERYGKLRFLSLYVVSGGLGSATSLAFSDAGLSAGASGAIFGILGAWVAVAGLHRDSPVMMGQLQSLLFLIGINMVIGFSAANIDVRAHIGGLAGGFVIALCLELSRRAKAEARAAVASAGYVAVLLATVLLTAPNIV